MPPDPAPYPLPPEPLPMDRPALLAALRARVGRLERAGAAAALARSQAGVVRVSDAIDAHLPQGGLARAGLHEVLAAESGAAAGFSAVMSGTHRRAGALDRARSGSLAARPGTLRPVALGTGPGPGPQAGRRALGDGGGAAVPRRDRRPAAGRGP